MCKVVPIAFSFTFALLVVPSASAQSRCEQEDAWANGTPAALNSIARRRAHAAWSVKVRSELGEAYATWRRARAHRTTCLRKQRQYVCTVSARPCRA
jgi:hypothetical protein